MKYKFLLVLALALAWWSCGAPKSEATGDSTTVQADSVVFTHPGWIDSLTIYEVNVRQFSSAGDFKGVEKHLNRLKDLGVDVLWFMPIHPIGELNRKGSLGSYYAVKDYKAVNPEFGTFADFKALVAKAHDMGFKVIIDWVANHTAWDNVWTVDHKDWYTLKDGAFTPPVADWADVIDLNYDNADMRAAMIDALKYWVSEADIDGYRCDVAGMVPLDFWQDARAQLDAIKPVFMLAEGEEHEYHDRAFDMSYGWELMGIFNRIASGKADVSALDAYYHKMDSLQATGLYKMLMITNHDENSWNGTIYKRLGDGVPAFATLTATMPGMPLVYSGIEGGLDHPLSFFEKDTIVWKVSPMFAMYQKLLALHKHNPALHMGAEMAPLQRFSAGDDTKIFAFTRQRNGHKVLVVANLSASEVIAKLPADGLDGEFTELNSGVSDKLPLDTEFKMKPWAYFVWYN